MFALSLIYIFRYQRRLFKQHAYLLILMIPFALGLALNLLSPEGLKGAFNFANRLKFFLVFVPLAVFINTKRQLDAVLASLVISGVIGALYSVIFSEYPYYKVLVSILVVARNADMLMAATLLCIVLLFKYPLENYKHKWIFRCILVVLVALFSWCILMGASMAALLGLLFGSVVFAALYERKLLFIPVAAIIAVSFIPQFKSIKDEVMISFDLTRDYEQTRARLHLWKTGIDFVKDYPLYGTGKREPARYFLNFFEQQPEEYQKKYYYAGTHYAGNFHNSFIQIMAEAGILFFILYMAAILYILLMQMIRIQMVPPDDRCYIMASVVVSAGFLAAQMFHGELHSYGSYTFYIAFFGGCFVLNQKVDWWRAGSAKPAESSAEEM